MSGARVTGPDGGADIHEVTACRLTPRSDRMTAALFHLLTHPKPGNRSSTGSGPDAARDWIERINERWFRRGD